MHDGCTVLSSLDILAIANSIATALSFKNNNNGVKHPFHKIASAPNLLSQMQTINPGSPCYAAPESDNLATQSPKMDIQFWCSTN